jgi:hypothetical protein
VTLKSRDHVKSFLILLELNKEPLNNWTGDGGERRERNVFYGNNPLKDHRLKIKQEPRSSGWKAGVCLARSLCCSLKPLDLRFKCSLTSALNVFEPQLSANQRLNQMSKPKFFIPFFFFL